MDVAVCMDPTLVAAVVSAMVLQKEMSLPSLRGHKEGMKLKLQVFEIANRCGCSFEVESWFNTSADNGFCPVDGKFRQYLTVLDE